MEQLYFKENRQNDVDRYEFDHIYALLFAHS